MNDLYQLERIVSQYVEGSDGVYPTQVDPSADRPEPLSRTALRAQRLKPAPGQEPARWVWSQRRREHIELYDPSLCIAMREQRVCSPAQLAALEAGRRARTHADCKDCGQSFEQYQLDTHQVCPACAGQRFESEHRARAAERKTALQAMVMRTTSGRTLYLDVETTGLSCSEGDEIVEIAVVDEAGQVLLESLVRPIRCQDWPEAQAVHGIMPADVASAPALEKLIPHLQDLFEQADTLVIYNATFDLSFLPTMLQPLASGKAVCAMQAFALQIGDWDERRGAFRWYSLMEAARHAGHSWEGNAHRALADAMAARTVWRWLRSQP